VRRRLIIFSHRSANTARTDNQATRFCNVHRRWLIIEYIYILYTKVVIFFDNYHIKQIECHHHNDDDYNNTLADSFMLSVYPAISVRIIAQNVLANNNWMRLVITGEGMRSASVYVCVCVCVYSLWDNGRWFTSAPASRDTRDLLSNAFSTRDLQGWY
jgi:hypothetical protein